MDNKQQTEQKEMRYVSTESLNTVLRYLGARPYGEVMQIIPLLVNLEIVKQEPEKTEEPVKPE